MFKLSITFASLAELSAFVTKMGASVQRGTIEHSQTIEGEATPAPATTAAPVKTPAQKAAETRAAKAAAKAAETASAPDTIGAHAAGPFPGAPTNFAPGMAAPTGSVHQPAPAAPQSAPVNAHVAQAPVAAQVVPAAQPMPAMAQPAPVTPERKQWNDACIALVNQLGSFGLPDTQLDTIMHNSFAQAGCPAGSTIRGLSDQQITQFYPVLQANVNAVAAQKSAQSYT